jgi:hypothetical protein
VVVVACMIMYANGAGAAPMLVAAEIEADANDSSATEGNATVELGGGTLGIDATAAGGAVDGGESVLGAGTASSGSTAVLACGDTGRVEDAIGASIASDDAGASPRPDRSMRSQ